MNVTQAQRLLNKNEEGRFYSMEEAEAILRAVLTVARLFAEFARDFAEVPD